MVRVRHVPNRATAAYSSYRAASKLLYPAHCVLPISSATCAHMTKPHQRALFLAAGLYVAALLGWFLSQPMPALQDLGEWVFQGAVMLRLLDPASPFHSQFQWVHIPVPNMFSQFFLMAGTLAVGPFWAAKLLVALYCLGAVWICGRAARRFAPKNPAPLFILLLGIAAFNSCFWHGYINFQIALLLLLLYTELTAVKSPTLAMVLIFSLLLFSCHASMCAAFVLIVLASEWRRTERLQIYASLLPSVSLLCFYLWQRQRRMPAGSHTHFGGLATHLAYKVYTVLKLGPFHNLVIANGQSAQRLPLLYTGGVVLNIVFSLCLAALLWVGIRTLLCDRRLSQPTILIWSALASLVLALPADLAEVVNLGERFLLLLTILILLAIAQSPSGRRLQAVAAWSYVLGFALTVAQLPAASLHSASAPEAFHRMPEKEGRPYASDGLFADRLYQNDERRIELRDDRIQVDPLLFDTGLLLNLHEEPVVAQNAAN